MTGYAITDEKKAIWVCKDKNGAYSLTTNKDIAEIFDNKILADRVFKSNLSKLIKSKGVTVHSIELQVGKTKAHIVEQPKPVEVPQEVKEEQSDVSKHIVDILSDAVSKLNDRYTVLSNELSKYDRQCSDIEHYIEFNAGKLNACEGYKAYKLLQDVLVERRKIKDELLVLKVVKDKMNIPDDVGDINTRITTLSERHYEPRELKWLFEPKEKKQDVNQKG